jgi:hypothetical protein
MTSPLPEMTFICSHRGSGTRFSILPKLELISQLQSYVGDVALLNGPTQFVPYGRRGRFSCDWLVLINNWPVAVASGSSFRSSS